MINANYYKTPDYYFMAIADYFQEYRMPRTSGIEFYTMWPGNHIEDAFETAAKMKLIPNVPDLAAVMKHQMIHDNPSVLPYDFNDCEIEPQCNIVRIGGHINDLKRFAAEFAAMLNDEAEMVSGDDSYFDYFPGFVMMFWCVCHELDMPDLYNETIADLRRARYDEDPDELQNY